MGLAKVSLSMLGLCLNKRCKTPDIDTMQTCTKEYPFRMLITIVDAAGVSHIYYFTVNVFNQL